MKRILIILKLNLYVDLTKANNGFLFYNFFLKCCLYIVNYDIIIDNRRGIDNDDVQE